MAGSKYIHIAKKLQTACNKLFGVKLLIDQKQWFHKDKNTAITVYTLYQVIDKDKPSKVKLFQTYSQVQLVLYMRDYWYELNGWEVPTDNKMWEDIKRKYGEKEEPSETAPVDAGSKDRWSTNCNRTAIYNELYSNGEYNGSSKGDSQST